METVQYYMATMQYYMVTVQYDIVGLFDRIRRVLLC